MEWMSGHNRHYSDGRGGRGGRAGHGAWGPKSAAQFAISQQWQEEDDRPKSCKAASH